MLELSFAALVIEWRGPAPFIYARMPLEAAAEVAAVKRAASYGWGAIPVTVRIGEVDFATSLFPKDGTYLLPLKASVRRELAVSVGDMVEVEMTVGSAGWPS